MLRHEKLRVNQKPFPMKAESIPGGQNSNSLTLFFTNLGE
jgi:hypothetical protein